MVPDRSPITPNPYSPAIRLLLIPLLVFIAWLIEIYLLAGNTRLLEQPEPAAIALYTVVASILTGMIIPLICIRKAFHSGSVNMFQTGFCSLHRTVLACSVTLVAGYCIVILFNPFGTDKIAFLNAFVLILPTAIASVMVCWVLAGTHLQAFARDGGLAVSITAGVVITSLLFTSSAVAMSPTLRQEGTLFWTVCAGMGAALFFFAVRDVYATSIVAAGARVLTGAGMFGPSALHGLSPWVYFVSLAAVLVLVAIHLYLSRHFTTIVIPAGRQRGPEK